MRATVVVFLFIMARRLRYFEPGSLIEVTTRTLRAFLRLKPNARRRKIILGVLGRAQEKFDLEIQLFVFLSNHYHLLCRPKDPQQLARAMCFINSNLARELGRLDGGGGILWCRRYQAIPVSDEPAAQAARFHYLLSHGCKEGLVLTPADWPGVHCVHALLNGDPLEGVWYDRSREYEARRQGIEPDPDAFATVYRVQLSPLPCWRDLSAEQRRERVLELIAEIEADARRRRAETGRDPVGAARIQAQHPLARPARSKRSPAPLVHAATRAARRAFLDAYRIFVGAYRQAAEKLRRGDLSARFPDFSFPPAQPFARPLADHA
jgi:hypothetical protein